MARTPVHAGESLAEELEELGVTPTKLSRQIRVPVNRTRQIVNGKRAVTGAAAHRLAHWFGTSPQLRMSLQALYDVRLAEQEAGRRSRLFRPGQRNPRPTIRVRYEAGHPCRERAHGYPVLAPRCYRRPP